MLNLTERIEAIVYARAGELTAGYGIVETGRDEDGHAHFKGAIDTKGYWACAKDGCKKKYPCREHGAHGKQEYRKGRTIEPDRVGFGINTDMVGVLIEDLKREGVRLSFDDAYGLLLEAHHQQSAYSLTNRTKDARKRKDAQRREERKKNGLCVSCGRPAEVKSDGDRCYYTSSCRVCSERATAYNRRKRAKA